MWRSEPITVVMRQANDSQTEIRVERLCKAFGERPVLRGVDLNVDRGEMVAIVGGSGSGKTVLMRHIVGHFRPNSGRVLVADHEAPGSPLVDLATLDAEGLDRLRTHWAIVFQHNALFSGTVYDNIALGLREVKELPESKIDPIVRREVKAVGLDVDRVLQLSRDELSGGMAKRVAIARALALDPLMVLYDEPTTGLDPHLAEQIQDLIAANHRRPHESGAARTTLVVTHDKDLLYRLRPRVVMLAEGRVFFDGSYPEFQQSDAPEIRPYLERMESLHRRTITE
jgi:phospholipid/cholesterol/gamma-HCH transport system ATP-binding protein